LMREEFRELNAGSSLLAQSHASSNLQRPLAQCVGNLDWVVGFSKETPALWQILLRYPITA
jgi:hypothetical protein